MKAYDVIMTPSDDGNWVLKSEADREIRHQKYNRCLAMAKCCKRKRIDAADYRIPRKKWEFYDKWYKRWIELAEKFKEAK